MLPDGNYDYDDYRLRLQLCQQGQRRRTNQERHSSNDKRRRRQTTTTTTNDDDKDDDDNYDLVTMYAYYSQRIVVNCSLGVNCYLKAMRSPFYSAMVGANLSENANISKKIETTLYKRRETTGR